MAEEIRAEACRCAQCGGKVGLLWYEGHSTLVEGPIVQLGDGNLKVTRHTCPAAVAPRPTPGPARSQPLGRPVPRGGLLLLLGLVVAGGPARADFSHVYSTGNHATADLANGTIAFAKLDVALGQAAGTELRPVAAFALTGTPAPTAATLTWAPAEGTTIAGLDVLGFAKPDGSPVGEADATHGDLTGTDLGDLDAAGSVDATSFLQSLISSNEQFAAFVVRPAPDSGAVLAPPTLTVAAATDWTPPPPLAGPPTVPEPASMILLAIGAAALSRRRRASGGRRSPAPGRTQGRPGTPASPPGPPARRRRSWSRREIPHKRIDA